MKTLNKVGLFVSATLFASVFFAQDALALRGSSRPSLSGDMSLGLGISTVSASQDDLNGAARDTGANVKDLSSAWEFYANWAYRISGTMYSIVLRPSYFMQSADGGGYKYDLNGYAIFPLLRLYALENYFIKFYFQTGVGYGALNGSITSPTHSLDYKGSAFGAQGGIGVEFCFTDSHCLTVEGNLRYLPIERNLTTGGSCTDGSIPGISQCGGSSEVERGGSDLKTTMSGVQGLIGYTMNF